MQQKKGELTFSASDLSGYISCKHLLGLNKKAAIGELTKPVRKNNLAEALQQLGNEFEQAYLDFLENEGKSVAKIDKESTSAYKETIEAMRSGADIIYQARLEMKPWQGWADFLVRVERPSDLGNWSYEVYDTKLSSNTKAGTILQITLYSEMISKIQGVMPERMYVKHPKGFEEYRVLDYSAYYRFIKHKFLEAVANPAETYPDPVNHCSVCNWWPVCDKVRRDDDHLQFVAGLGKSQLKELRSQGIEKLEQLAKLPLPLPFRPNRGSVRTYEKLREQARLQLLVRETKQPKFELLPRFPNQVPSVGFFNLPEPHEDDIFLDLEGDPLVMPNGREYIFGYWFKAEYYIYWGEDEEAEKRAFEDFIDLAYSMYLVSPEMHIYHFGAYETSAFKRLMQKYATRIEEMDTLLRTKSFVDLHQIVRQSVIAGVEKYSLKDLEKYHGYLREADLRSVAPVKAGYELLLETGRVSEATPEMRDVIKEYNKDDCRSTEALFKWLCQLRQELRENGEDIPAPEKPSGESKGELTKHQEMIKPILDALLKDLPADRSIHSPLQQANYLVAHMMDWYGRELKKVYWDMFRLQEADELELLDDAAALYGLIPTGERETIRTAVIDNYRYDKQECDIKDGDKLLIHGSGETIETVSIDRSQRIIRLKKPGKIKDVHPVAVFKHDTYIHREKIARIVQIGNLINTRKLDLPELKCAIDLLLREKPSVSGPVEGNKDTYDGRLEWLLKLDGGVLPIQGPPGTGKTYTASRLIVGLIKAGKKVGITALSHKVITNLLWGVREAGEEMDIDIKMLQKPDGSGEEQVPWETRNKPLEISNNLDTAQVIAGTSNLWAHPLMEKSVDYLFVDEAGQLSLVDTLVCCFATKNLVLIGDPQQLRQPIQGVHPDGIDVSALEHLFKGNKTITAEQGIFLGTTWRMHPKICKFNSDLYYDSRLLSLPKLENQRTSGNTAFLGSGLFYSPVTHEGNSTYSLEEVDEVERIFNALTKGDVFWEDSDGNREVVGPEHIRIITPYNSQRYEITQRLNGFREVGTVDKFQGQEAPIVIYSTVTSSAEDIPRGMEFLYSPNRFNVAVSRARAAFILVGSPLLFEPECKSPEQMKLANGFCYFLEKI